jgi:hypothetical protein
MRMHLPCNRFAPEMHPEILGSAHGAAQLHRECTVRPTPMHPVRTQNATATVQNSGGHRAADSKTPVVEHKGLSDIFGSFRWDFLWISAAYTVRQISASSDKCPTAALVRNPPVKTLWI